MVAGVEIEFFERPTDNEIHIMSLAAQEFTKDPFTVEISKSDDLPNIATAIRKQFNQTMYTPQHLAAMLEKAGFATVRICGDFDGSPIRFDSIK